MLITSGILYVAFGDSNLKKWNDPLVSKGETPELGGLCSITSENNSNMKKNSKEKSQDE